MAYRFESGHRHQKKETPPKWVVFFFFMLETDSNPIKCPMPVAWGSHQFKNWWQPYDLPPKGQIGHRVRHRSSPNRPRLCALLFLIPVRTRTHLNAPCQWHGAATSSKTGGIYTICPPRGKSAIESGHRPHWHNVISLRPAGIARPLAPPLGELASDQRA